MAYYIPPPLQVDNTTLVQSNGIAGTSTATRTTAFFLNGSGDNVTSKVYRGLIGSNTAVEATAQRRLPRAGTLSRVDATWTLVLAVETLTLIVRINGSDVASTTIAATGATTGRSTVSGLSDAFSAGDLVCYSAQLTTGVNQGQGRGMDLTVVWNP